jgi:hypothetical protein
MDVMSVRGRVDPLLGTLATLPNEIHLRILSYLPFQDLANVRRVSTALKLAAEDEGLWKTRGKWFLLEEWKDSASCVPFAYLKAYYARATSNCAADTPQLKSIGWLRFGGSLGAFEKRTAVSYDYQGHSYRAGLTSTGLFFIHELPSQTLINTDGCVADREIPPERSDESKVPKLLVHGEGRALRLIGAAGKSELMVWDAEGKLLWQQQDVAPVVDLAVASCRCELPWLFTDFILINAPCDGNPLIVTCLTSPARPGKIFAVRKLATGDMVELLQAPTVPSPSATTLLSATLSSKGGSEVWKASFTRCKNEGYLRVWKQCITPEKPVEKTYSAQMTLIGNVTSLCWVDAGESPVLLVANSRRICMWRGVDLRLVQLKGFGPRNKGMLHSFKSLGMQLFGWEKAGGVQLFTLACEPKTLKRKRREPAASQKKRPHIDE